MLDRSGALPNKPLVPTRNGLAPLLAAQRRRFGTTCIAMKQLSKSEYLATMAEPMERLPSDAEALFPFWNYFDAIPSVDFEGHDCSEGSVTYVWQHPNGNYQHVLVNSEDKNVFLVLVVDLASRSVIGHRLLDLNHEYGLERT